MIQIVDKSNCCGCGACASVCPCKSITMIEDDEGFIYPKVNQACCSDCGLCNRICPEEYNGMNDLIGVYAISNINESERLKSTSGGVFPLLAKHIIDKGGAIVAVVFSSDYLSVNYDLSMNDPFVFCGSKYLQADVSRACSLIKENSSNDSPLLVVGLPCQIVALRQLFKRRKNIVYVDVACHGVPSPKTWRDYLLRLINKHHSQPISVSFRDKISGWKDYSFTVTFGNGRHYVCRGDKDLFMRSYRSNLNLRPSCYKCKFKLGRTCGDLQLADFWGIDRYYSDLDDDKGTSLILVNTIIGYELIRSIEKEARIVSVDSQKALSGNPSITTAAFYPKNREAFFSSITKYGTYKALRMFCNVSLRERLDSCIIRMKNLMKQMLCRV